MRPRLIGKTGSVSFALAMAAIGLPALAQEAPAPVAAPTATSESQLAEPAGQNPPVFGPVSGPVFGLSPQARAEWLSECRRRMSWNAPYTPWYDHHKSWHDHRMPEASGGSRDVCETYLDDYYAYYANAYASYARYVQANSDYAHAAYTASCCRKKPDCTETVEYEEVPMRPAARRIPSRPTKTVPDKRIPVN